MPFHNLLDYNKSYESTTANANTKKNQIPMIQKLQNQVV